MTAYAIETITVTPRTETFDILHFDALEDVRAWLTTVPKDQPIGRPGSQSACLVHNYATYKLTGDGDPANAINNSSVACYRSDYSYVGFGKQEWQSHPLNCEMSHLSYSFDHIGRRYADAPSDEDDGVYQAVTVQDAIDLVDQLISTRGDWTVIEDD
jgi:hypothetical protein